MTNEILEETWRIKQDIAREHENDLDRLVATLLKAEQQSPVPTTTLAPQPTSVLKRTA